MVEGCAPLASDGPFLSGALAFIDCQAQAIGEGGWRALAARGSTGAIVLDAALVLFVALLGYRLLLGEQPTVRDGMIAVAKVGIVLLLAASWPAFRALAYDTTMRGPAQLAATIAAPAALPGVAGDMSARLQGIDDGLAELAKLGTGKPPDADVLVGPTQALSPEEQQAQLRHLQQVGQRPRWDPQRDGAILADARAIFLTATLAAVGSVRLTAGLLLALGPVLVVFLLFEATRGLFEGWVRALGGVTLAATATAIVLGCELAAVEPWLGGILDQRRADTPTPEVPIELIGLISVFAIVLLAVLAAAARVAYGFRLPAARRAAATALPAGWQAIVEERRATAARAATAVVDRPRAAQIAAAIEATQRRETAVGLPAAARLARALDRNRSVTVSQRGESDPGGRSPTRHADRRQVAVRMSGEATRRDRLS